MADPTSMTTVAAAGKLLASEHADVLREAVRLMLIEIMEAEVAQVAGGGRYERSGERSSYRNGYRERPWDTRVGSLELAIPRLRSGSYFPSFLEPRRRSEQALVAVVAAEGAGGGPAHGSMNLTTIRNYTTSRDLTSSCPAVP